jgi:hypothetical protein
MSFHFHPGSYDSVSAKHQELMAEAELQRQLDAAVEERPGLAARIRLVCGMWLIAVGERIARPASAASRT